MRMNKQITKTPNDFNVAESPPFLKTLWWTAWDSPEVIGSHIDIRDGVGTDFTCLLIITFDNGAARISSTRRPQTMLREAIDYSQGIGTRINSVLVSKPQPGLDRSCDRLCKSLLRDGYRSLGKRTFEGLPMQIILRTLSHSYPHMDQPIPAKSVDPESTALGADTTCPTATIVPTKTIDKRFSETIVGGSSIRVDNEGRYCLNDLHRASGGNNAHRPSLWVENKQTQELIAEILKAGIPALTSIKGGRHNGTYVCKELVYAYAMWVSPRFHLTVIRAFDAMSAGSQVISRIDPEVEHAIDERVWRIVSEERERLLSLLGPDAEEDTWKIAVRIKRRLQHELKSLVAKTLGDSYSENVIVAINSWIPAAFQFKRYG